MLVYVSQAEENQQILDYQLIPSQNLHNYFRTFRRAPRPLHQCSAHRLTPTPSRSRQKESLERYGRCTTLVNRQRTFFQDLSEALSTVDATVPRPESRGEESESDQSLIKKEEGDEVYGTRQIPQYSHWLWINFVAKDWQLFWNNSGPQDAKSEQKNEAEI